MVAVQMNDPVVAAAIIRSLQAMGFRVVSDVSTADVCLADKVYSDVPTVIVVPAMPAACAGARSVVLAGGAFGAATDAEMDLVPTVVRSVADGVVALTPGVLTLADQMPSLSTREMAVLELVAEGTPLSQVARHLHLSHATVKRELASLFAAMGVASRVELVLVARRLGLLGG